MKKIMIIFSVMVYMFALSGCEEQPKYQTTCNYTRHNKDIEEEIFVYGEKTFFEHYQDGVLIQENYSYESWDAKEYMEMFVSVADDWGQECDTITLD